MRIEFCEADVLDAFDDWRRAVGVARVVPDSAGGPDVEEPQPSARPRKSLASQIESALARLTVMRGSDKAGPRSTMRSTPRCGGSMRCGPKPRALAARPATS